MDGVLNIRKPAGPTSHDVVDRVRRLFDQKRVGHAGTLDPQATGVLVVCLGKATRIVEYITGADKEYRAAMILGVTTDTQDSSGTVTDETDASHVTRDDVEAAAQGFVGEIEQVPPMISALKHEGKPLYKHAREGRTVERKARGVTVYSLLLDDFRPGERPEVGLLVTCSSGTYIRTLCADIGEALGCGAIMSSLERTRVGGFTIDAAITLDQLAEAQSKGTLEQHVLPMAAALAGMPEANVTAEDERRLLHGLSVATDFDPSDGGTVRIMAGGELIAIGAVEAGHLRPHKVLKEVGQ